MKGVSRIVGDYIDLRDALIRHGARYPEMRPRDAVKLIYQNEFGPGHLLGECAWMRLNQELADVPLDPNLPLCEGIGGGMSRVMISAWKQRQWSGETLYQSFAESAQHQGEKDVFLEKLNVLRQVCCEQSFYFTHAEMERYLSEYIAADCPVVSHSEEYRRAYQPAYRVVRNHCLIHAMIEEKRREKVRVIVAIDGRCASGKSTLAKQLEENYGWPVVHMDDFFLRPEQRTSERYAQPGGNIDYERFSAEVLAPCSRGERVCYRPFDCHTMTLSDPVALPDSPVVIVEGSYSCHPALREFYDLKIFLSVEPRTQMERIIAREGEPYAQVFRQKWIPLEEAYFAAYDVEHGCDICFS